MLLPWLLYACAVALLAAGAAWMLERGLRALRLGTRWVWLAAMGFSLAVPVTARLIPRPAPAALGVAAAPKQKVASVTTRVAAAPTLALPVSPGLRRYDRPLTLLWIGSTLLALLVTAGMSAALARRRSAWRRVEVEGVPVWISPDTGPAVVGLLRGQIVLPEWSLRSSAADRRLVLDHELEHIRAGDVRLLALGVLLAVLVPWNPALWWQLRRLRLAVEVDCDARVLRRSADVAAYGAVLLEVGRRSVRERMAAAAFAEPISTLERRIRIMTASPVRRPLLRGAACAIVALALVVAACETPGPAQPSASGSRRLAASPEQPAGSPRARLSLGAAIHRYFPEVERDGVRHNELLVFTATAAGDVVRAERRMRSASQVAAASADRGGVPRADTDAPTYADALEGLDRSTVSTVDLMTVRPGDAGPTAVPVVWIQLADPAQARAASADAAEAQRAAETGTPLGRPRRPAFSIRSADSNTGVSATTVVGEPAVFPADLDPAAHPGQPDSRELAAARERFWTPGVPGDLRVRYTVGADGRARVVKIDASSPALEAIGRQIMDSLHFPAREVSSEAQIWLSAAAPASADKR